MPPCITPYPHLYPNNGNWFHAWHGLYSDEYETEVARKQNQQMQSTLPNAITPSKWILRDPVRNVQ
jgi:hypothetical protein